ncbi:dynein axonemal assembly factor 8-like [Watersipora subatra]|uniref:dynein axonemal assembly factor 8-like n=1 Tax=Watersipora subatra TaxID=2589382 RepID=UPI00355C964D
MYRAYKKEGNSLFARYTQKFLSLTNLVDVNPWLSDWSSSPVKSAAPNSQYAYTAHNVQISSKPMSTYMQVQTNPDSVKQYFGDEIGFHWQTVHNEEQSYYSDDEPKLTHDELVETTMVLLTRPLYVKAMLVVTVLTRMYAENLEIAGIRLACFPAVHPGILCDFSVPGHPGVLCVFSVPGHPGVLCIFRVPGHPGVLCGFIVPGHPGVLCVFSVPGTKKNGPFLAVALRGTEAFTRWMQQMGPADPELAKKVDQTCLMAHLGGTDKDHITLFTPRTRPGVDEHLGRWFGGRFSSDAEKLIRGKELARLKKTSSCSPLESLDGLGRAAPVALLSATTTADCFVVISTIFPVKFIGLVFGKAQRRGFSIRGARRRHLNQKQVSALGREKVCYCHHCVPRPVTIIHLSKENVSHHTSMLLEAIIVHVILQELLDICANENTDGSLCRSSFLHFAPFSTSLLAILGRDFAKVPEADSPASTSYIPPRLHSNSELEQISLVAFIGNNVINSAFSDLCNLQEPKQDSDENQEASAKESGLELLGIKWLPSLNTSQAREITPYEVGQSDWKKSIKVLTGKPTLVMMLRGVNCTSRIKEVVYSEKKVMNRQLPSLEIIVTNTPELTYRLATLFFFDRELFADYESRPNTKYLPPMRTSAKLAPDCWEEDRQVIEPLCQNITGSCKWQKYMSMHATTKTRKQRANKSAKSSPCTPPLSLPPREDESIFKTMLMGPRPLVTLLTVKPGLLGRHKLHRILFHILQEKFSIVGLRLLVLTELEAACLQSSVTKQDEKLLQKNIQHMTSGPSMLIALQRENAIKKLEDMLGPDDPAEAKAVSPFCLRGFYGTDLPNNGLYCSTSYHRAVSDIKQFFPEGLCCPNTADLQAEDIAAPGVDHIISATSRRAKGRSAMDPGLYNLNRLNEVNCLVLLPPLVRLEAKSSKFTDIVQCLQTCHNAIISYNYMMEE